MKLRFVSSLIIIQLLAGVSMAAAQTLSPSPNAPTLFRRTGILTAPDGTPRNGTVTIVASIFPDGTDPTPLWSEEQPVTLGADGSFVINVGSTLEDGVPKDLFVSGTGRWLGLSVKGEAELTPRTMLVSVAYAVKAREADTLGGKAPSDFMLANGRTPLTNFADTLSVSGFGTSAFQSSGAGQQGIIIRNTASGTANLSAVQVGNDVDAAAGYFYHTSSNYSSGSYDRQNSFVIIGRQPGGVSLAASDAAGALRFYSGGGTERMRVDPSGNVGIGTSSPSAKLDVNGLFSASGFGTHLFQGSGVGQQGILIRNLASGAGNLSAVQIGNDVDAAAGYFYHTSSNYSSGSYDRQNSFVIIGRQPGGISLAAGDAAGTLRFYSGGGNERMRIDASGNIGIGTSSPTAKLDVTGNINVSGNINAKYQDVAEWVETPSPLEDGTVVIVDPAEPNRVIAASTAYDTRVAGAVSRQPGLILGDKGDGKAMVAANGRVRIKVDASYGAIQIGDLLVTSDTPGYAMISRPVTVGGVTFHRAGTLLGKALEALPSGKGEILVLLMLQ